MGEETKGFIRKIREDGKIDVSLQQTGFAEVQDASQQVLDKLKAEGGTLNLSDSSDPQDIYAALGMSKKTFKKAIGTLYRAGKVRLEPNRITLTGEE
jgi:predicted RNA-binding protein (virulence factor B family)